jgi:hypothetical protein
MITSNATLQHTTVFTRTMRFSACAPVMVLRI